MYSPDERYITVGELEQGKKFTYKDEPIMKLPEFVECYGEKANAVNIKTGTMLYIEPDTWVDQITMKVEE